MGNRAGRVVTHPFLNRDYKRDFTSVSTLSDMNSLCKPGNLVEIRAWKQRQDRDSRRIWQSLYRNVRFSKCPRCIQIRDNEYAKEGIVERREESGKCVVKVAGKEIGIDATFKCVPEFTFRASIWTRSSYYSLLMHPVVAPSIPSQIDSCVDSNRVEIKVLRRERTRKGHSVIIVGFPEASEWVKRAITPTGVDVDKNGSADDRKIGMANRTPGSNCIVKLSDGTEVKITLDSKDYWKREEGIEAGPEYALAIYPVPANT
jgi:hypothetical protein